MQRRSAPPNLISNIITKSSNIFNKITNDDTNKLEIEKLSENDNHLLTSIEGLNLITTFAHKTADAQEISANSLEKWVKQTPNNAIGDIVGWTCELLRVYAEQQRKFAYNYEHFIGEFKKVFDIEKDIQEEEEKIKKLSENERNLYFAYNNKNNENNKEDGRKFFNLLKLQSLPKDENEVKNNWYDAVGELMVTEEEVEKKKEKAEIIKMEYLRLSLKGISESYCNFANITNLIFSCQSDLTEFIPKISTIEDLRNMKYVGIPKTRKIMKKLEKELFDKKIQISSPSTISKYIQPRRQSDPLSLNSNKNIKNNNLIQRLPKILLNNKTNKKQFEIAPPPPYTPTAPTVEQIELSENEEENKEKEYQRTRIIFFFFHLKN
ncbi:hypothetical protein Mgra_00006308 [Meloidogyne graminicola]|uniref:Uncharacterized protein n=1 Tax=Meloidogyne graminicola TaxID=189291 RepID=A0A8S9ZM09_9BILA|nr:hypothetical protein Mgra_00006308 [Meloidogyne graminicola]